MLFIRRTFSDDRTDVAVLLVEYLARTFGVDADGAFCSPRSPLAWLSDATSAGRVRTATSNLVVWPDGLCNDPRTSCPVRRSRDVGTRTYNESSDVEDEGRGVCTFPPRILLHHV
jgi:hypothetical protein